MTRPRSLPLLAVVTALALMTAQAPSAQEDPQTEPATPGIRDQTPEMARDIDYWTEVLTEAPDDATFRLALANAYAFNNRLEDATREYRKVLRSYPSYKIAWNNLGSAYRAMGKKGQALRAYRAALELDPHYGLAYYNIGVVYDSEGYYERAIENYGLAVRYDPKLIEIQHNPQVVTNRYLFAILLNNYIESAGALALPLEPALPMRSEE